MTSNSLPKKSYFFISWLAWGVVTLFYAYQYILRVFPSVVMEEIQNHFHVGPDEFGYFSGAYYLGYALMHIPFGVLFDRFKASIILLSSILLGCVGLLPFFFDLGWNFMILGRFLVGAASTAAILGVFKVTRLLFPAEKFGRILGISVAIGLVGALNGGRSVQTFLELYGFDVVLKGIFVMGLILAGVSYAVLSISQKYTDGQSSQHFSFALLIKDLRDVLKMPQFLAICFFSALMVGPLEGFADVWVIPFLKAAYSYSAQEAASLQGLIFIAMGVGSPVLAYLAEKRKAYVSALLLSAFAMLVAFLGLQTGMLSSSLVFGAIFALGFFSAYQVLVMHLVSMRVGAVHVGLATALTNMVIMSFGSVFHTSIGKTLSVTRDPQVQTMIDKMVHTFGGGEEFSQNWIMQQAQSGLLEYNLALAIIPVSLLLSFIAFAVLAPKLKKRV